MESANFSANEKNADFPPTGKGMNQKTAGAERRRTRPPKRKVKEEEARADPDSVGRERGLISLGRVGVELGGRL